MKILTDSQILSSEWWSSDIKTSKYYRSFNDVVLDYGESHYVTEFSRIYFLHNDVLPLYLMAEEDFISKWVSYGMNWWEVEQHRIT